MRIGRLVSQVTVWTRSLSPLSALGITLLCVIVALAALAPLITRWGPTEIDFESMLSPPGTPNHLLGTDRNGMDILSRILYAARIDVGVAIASVAIAASVGSAVGAVVGFVGGWVDDVAMRVVDVLQSFPAFIFALGVAVVIGTSIPSLILLLALVNTSSYVRIMRAEVRATREHGWVEAARCAGLSSTHILFRQVVPNSMRPTLVIAPLNCGWVILLLASLSFVGLGIPVPEAEWGAMISAGTEEIASGIWWTSVVPGIMLFLTVLGFSLASEGAQLQRPSR
ncbi:MAG: ABC transporter permease [Gaiellales bacterium]